MSVYPFLRWAVPFLLLVLATGQSGAINCVQCNVYVRGHVSTCTQPRNVTDCYACLKTHTKISIHERWLEFRSSDVVSRMCVFDTATALIRDPGCYRQSNNGGYTEMCYCYSDYCNSGPVTRLLPALAFLPVASLSLLLLR